MTTNTTDHTGRPILWSATRGIVTGQTEKRGRVLLSVTLADGRAVKLDLDTVEFTDIERFAPATGAVTFGQRDSDHYGNLGRMFARSTSWRG